MRVLLDMALPPMCRGCGTRIPLDDPGPLCKPCRDRVPLIDHQGSICQICGHPDPAAASDGRCRHCFPKAPLELLRSGARYHGLTVTAVERLKYGGRTEYASMMAEWMLPALHNLDPDGTAILVPIPLHSVRLRERGFNQAEILCQELSLISGRLIDSVSLVRIRATPSQTRLTREQRAKNVQGAFEVRNLSTLNATPFRDKTIILVDDVATTGATLIAAARAFKPTSPARILGLTACRASVILD